MAIALVATVSEGVSGTTSAAITTSGANFLIAIQAWTTVGSVTTNLTDSKSNVWVPILTSHARNAGTTASVTLYFAAGSGLSVGTLHTFTVGVGAASICVAAFSGVHATNPIGVGKIANSASANTLAAGSITPGLSNALVIAGLSYRDTTTISIDGGFTITNQEPFVAGTTVGSALAYLIQTTPTAANPTWSWTTATACEALVLDISAVQAAAGFPGFFIQ